ncbi:MAG: oligosaccharide flippase family protein [candidate division Zixibacteria bacterium]|nr:oligosaccharide flippase family protein [candidate division Zixibacteria bacterium]
MRKAISNFSWILFADGIGKATNFGYSLLLSRSLAVSGFGIFSYIIAFVELFSVLYDLGLNMGIIKQVASNPATERSFVSNAGKIKLVAAIVCFVLILSISFSLGDNREILFLLVIYLVGYTARSYTSMFQSLAIAHERLKFLASFMILDNALIITGAGLIFVFAPSLLNYIAYSSILSLVIASLWFYFGYYRRAVRGSFTVSGEKLALRNIFSISIPFFLVALFTNIYFRIDVTMLKHMKGSEDVAFYTAGYRIFMLIMTIPWVLNRNILLPKILKDESGEGEMVLKSFPQYLRITLILTFVVAFAVFTFSQFILTSLFGNQYAHGSLPLSILIWSVPFCTLGAYFNNIIIRESPKLLALITGAILVPTNVLLNIPLIPRFGGTGAAISTLVTESIGCFAGYLACRRLAFNLPIHFRQDFLPSFTALLAILLAVVFVNFWALKIGLIGVYILIVYLLGGFKQLDLSHIIKGEK